MTVRLMIGRPLPGVVGESRRVVHLFPGTGRYPDTLTAYCGEAFWSGDLEWLDGPAGMPCTVCLLRLRRSQAADPRPVRDASPEIPDAPHRLGLQPPAGG